MTPKRRAVPVDTADRYTVHVGARIAGDVARRCEGWKRTFVLTDENVARHHAGAVSGIRRSSLHVIAPGEASKSFATLEKVLDAMVAAGCDRASGLVAFGGGVVGDLGGLAAALFHRGIPYVQLPTTLLAMVDSSVGGKTAVNLLAGKNLAGTFWQPVEVFADTTFLTTLPDEEYRSGLGEVLKMGVIVRGFFDELVECAPALVRRDPETVARVVEVCVGGKATVVARDWRERGDRRLLNLGHTFAHAIEHVAGYGRVPHGIAVAVGIDLVLRAARAEVEKVSPELHAQFVALARALGLPATLTDLARAYETHLAPEALLAAMPRDKKSRGGRAQFVVPYAPGFVRYDVEIAPEAVRAALESSATA